MLLGKVIGSVVATQKHAKFQGMKLLLVQPYVATGTVMTESGSSVVAVDSVGAGLGSFVLFTQGSSARLTATTKDSPTDAVIVGIVDTIEMGGTKVEMPR
jgi:ethanolamine utilization protein EutN